MERKPESTETFAQYRKLAPAALFMLKEHHRVVRIPHEPAPPPEVRLDLVLEPLIQHMVQDDVREQRIWEPYDYGNLSRLGR